MEDVLRLENLKFSYGVHKTFTFPDLILKQNEQLLILGNSGIGKSTLLHLIAMLLKPESGKILLNGKDTAGLSQKETGHIRAQEVGIVFQQHHFVKSLNVLENLTLVNYFSNKPQNEKKAKDLSRSLQIDHLLKQPIYELSGGEKQRVGIARALMNDPSLVLADEPTASLDDKNCEAVYRLLTESCKRNRAALVIVTHDQRLKSLIPNQLILS
ncbi:ABC transporter ATP-binding protein [Jiulongibacter sediminis]|jgi:putative ABC transport system ATP-binding protein|uniref:ABC transporter ATP-binding protein n=1 Tax=Jiulongibacter sediminis TaxID=1605367 RepID=UPI0026EB668E|nr:ABC transporter ATP-binding protein [Jiulongibacter sediminis]